MFDLSGKIVLLTGGGGARVGTGAGIAKTFARQGAVVAVNDKDEAAAKRTVDAIESAGGTAAVFPFDVRDPDDIARGVAAVRDRFGPIDVLVNSAGGGAQHKFRDMDATHWARIVELNLFGVVNCTRAVIDAMCERGYGRIITIASSSAFVGSSVGLTAYGAGKAGAVGFTRQLAVEVAPHGVTVNCIAPGFVWGDDEDLAPSQRGRDLSHIVPAPVGRTGKPADVGAVCVFLASDEASFITGQTLHINGGSYTT